MNGTWCIDSGIGTLPPPGFQPDLDLLAGSAVLTVDRPLDGAEVTDLADRICALPDACRCLVLDLTGAATLGEDGIRLLCRIDEELPQTGRSLRLVVAPDSPVARTLCTFRLTQRFDVYESVSEARC